MNNDKNHEEKNLRQSPIFPLGVKMQKESKFIQKRKEYMKNKKAVSMKHVFGAPDNINININQSININANPNIKFLELNTKKKEKKNEGNDNESKPQSEEGNKKKGMAMKSCILGLESEHKKEKQTILSMNINRTKINNRTDFDSSVKMEKLLERQSKIDIKDEKKNNLWNFI
jgi:hypothetical protein